MKSVKISKVGPIRELTIPIPEQGGVVVLEGPNGSGKSTALRAVGALASGTGASDLTVLDTELAGSVEGLGARITLGLGRKRGGVSGALECRSLDSGLDPSVLVDPGLKDPEAADARRIAMLCRFAGVKADLSLFSANARTAATPKVTSAEDLPAMASALRRALHEAALAKEREAEKLGVDIQTQEAAISDVNLDAPSESEVRASLDRASANRAELQAQARAYQSAARSAETARLILERAQSSQVADLMGAVDRARESHEQARELLRSAEIELARAQERVFNSKRDLEGAARALEDALQALTSAQEESKRVDGARAVLSELDSLPNPSPENLDEADAEVAKLTGLVGEAQAAAKARAKLGVIDQLRVRASTLATEAATLRSEAEATDDVVAGAIARVSPMGLRVEAGRLVIATERGKTPWDELSHGERWRIAFECAIAAVGAGGLLSIRQEAWEGLDPEHRTEIAKLAEERGVVVVTAEASDGELRAEVFESPTDIESVEG